MNKTQPHKPAGAMRKICQVASLLTAGIPALASAQDFVDGNLIQFNNNGAWCWFQDERAIIDFEAGWLLVNSITDHLGYGGGERKSDVEVAAYDLETGTRTVAKMGDFGSHSDDHNNGSLLRRTDGRYLMIWSSHGADDLTRYRISSKPGDATNWEPTQTFDNHTSPGPGTTYSNVFHLPDADPVPLTYNFTRTRGYDPNFLISRDEGETWEYGGYLAKDPDSSDGGRPYVKYASNGSNRVYFITTEAHPSQYHRQPLTGIYAGYVEDGASYKMDGTLVRAAGTSNSVATAPFATEYSTVFEPGTRLDGTVRNRCWTTDLAVDSNGMPYGIFTSRVNDNHNDHRYYYTRWNGTDWEVHELAKAGGTIYPKSRREPDYTGLAALNPENPNEVYISSTINPITGASTPYYEIYKGLTADRGATWAWTAVTIDSTVHNLRPIMPAGNGETKALLWLRGHYLTYVDFDLAVVGLVDRAGSNPVGPIQYVDATTENTVSVSGQTWLSGSGVDMGPTDDLWFERTGFGNGGSVFSADEAAAENAPMLRTTLRNLAPGVYDVYGFFWSDKDEQWQLRAGFDVSAMLAFEKLGAQHVPLNALKGADTTTADTNDHYLYKVYLGRTQVTDETLSIYVKDGISELAGRTWYDGIGYAPVPSQD